MDQQRAQGGRYSPQPYVEGFDLGDAVLLEEGTHQQDGTEGEEDVLTEEDRHVVTGGSMGPYLVTNMLGQVTMTMHRGPLCHGGDQRTHRLGMAPQAQQPQHGRALAQHEIEHQDAGRGGLADAGDPALRPLLEAIAFQQADHRQDQDQGGQLPTVEKLLAEGLQQPGQGHASRQTCRQPRRRHHQQRIEFQSKTQHHHGDPYQWQ
ncbi:hypothetical protein D3C78_666180 [compost metagenome]